MLKKMDRLRLKPAQLFWKRVIDEYTQGQFTERFEDGKRIQNFDN